jgi:RNA polymerase sigma-70 factor, ECF subfamily
MDLDLVEQAQHGDRDAFGILARTRGDRLFGIANRILRDIHRSEDAVQQTLVIAWRELPRLRDPDRFDAWITRLLVHACYQEARRVAGTSRRDLTPGPQGSLPCPPGGSPAIGFHAC